MHVVKKIEVVRDNARLTVLLRSEPASERLEEAASRIALISTDGDGCVLPYHQEPDSTLIANLQSVIFARGDSFGFTIVTGNHENSASVRFATEVGCPSFCELGNVRHEPSGNLVILIKEKDVKFMAEVVKPLLDAFITANFPGHKVPPKRTMLSYTRPDGVSIQEFVGAIKDFMARDPYAHEVRKHLEMSYWTSNTLDITFKGDNKGKAIQYMTGYYRVEKNQMIYVGDGNNDIPAFRRVLNGGGIAIAPANADSDVMRFASHDKTGRMILHPLESTECMWDIASTVFVARNHELFS
jgi:hydroxymethylpyrimidine pyrophosphatase-like HAD family hydrolase